jgi:hypothetical protein
VITGVPVPAIPSWLLEVISAFFDLADAVITVRSLIRQAWVIYRWDTRPTHR